jgi:hypothetical protein
VDSEDAGKVWPDNSAWIYEKGRLICDDHVPGVRARQQHEAQYPR